MNILICVKQVPCVEKMKYDELTQTVLRQKDDIINTEEAGILVFSGIPAFFVTIVLLVQRSPR